MAPTPDITAIKVTPEQDRRANHVAEHAAITTAMNAPADMDPNVFYNLVIEKMRAKKDEKIRQFTRKRGL